MIKVQTFLKISDNSGGINGLCIRILKNSKRIGAQPGEIIKISVKKSRKKKFIKKSKEVKKGQLYMALVIRTVRGLKRWGNFFLKMSNNAIVIINQYSLPLSTRIFGPIFSEIREDIKYSKIISLAQMIL